MSMLLSERLANALFLLQGMHSHTFRNRAKTWLLPPARGKVGMGVIKVDDAVSGAMPGAVIEDGWPLYDLPPSQPSPFQGEGAKARHNFAIGRWECRQANMSAISRRHGADGSGARQ